AGTVRARPPSHDRGRTGAAGGGVALARATAGAGNTRPAGLLARQLRGGQSGDEGPLSAPSLAGRSARGAGDPPRQAARDVGASWDSSICKDCLYHPLTMAAGSPVV